MKGREHIIISHLWKDSKVRNSVFMLVFLLCLCVAVEREESEESSGRERRERRK